MIGYVTLVLFVLLALFGALDVYAMVSRGKDGETFSEWDQKLEAKHWWFRVINVIVLVALFVHLALGVG